MYGGPKICVKSRVLSIRASQGENVMPLPKDNGVATLESVIGEPPSKGDDRRERVEALIERVCARSNHFHYCSITFSKMPGILEYPVQV